MTLNEMQRAAIAALRRLADEIERGAWADATYEMRNDIADKPRMSWQAYAGKEIVGRDLYVSVSRPDRARLKSTEPNGNTSGDDT